MRKLKFQNSGTLGQTATLSEISLENEQFSVINVPLSSKDEPFILTTPETVINEEGCNVVEVEVHIPFIQNDPICVPMLVVPKSDLSDRVPVIVGTNILRICHEKLEYLDEEVKIPKQWNTAFLSSHNNSGVVRSSNRRPLTLHPSSFMTVSGMVKMKGSSFDDNGTLITENCSDIGTANIGTQI
jgi:hypothetical protein